METYAIKITQTIPGSDDEQVLFSKPLKSEDHRAKLKKRLILDDTKLARFGNYFPETKKALKIQNVISRIFHTIKAFFSDIITQPSNYKTRFKENIPVYKYLQSKGIPSRYSNKELLKYIYFITYTDNRASDGQIKVIEDMKSKDATLSNFTKSNYFAFARHSTSSTGPLLDEFIITRRFVTV